MRAKNIVRGVSVSVLFLSVLAFSACTIPLYHQTGKADQKIKEVKTVFDEVDGIAQSSFELSEKVYRDSLAEGVMKSNLDEVQTKQEELKESKEKIESTQSVIDEINAMRLPADYKEEALPKITEARSKRLEVVDVAEDLLFKSENLSSAIVNYYSATNRMENAVDKLDSLEELDFDDPETFSKAKAVFEEVSSEIKQSQSEYNAAAASVNAEVFSRLRDSVNDFSIVAESLDKIIVHLEELYDCVQKKDKEACLKTYEELLGEYQVFTSALQNFSINFPYDLVKGNDFTTKGENQIQVWKDENFKNLFDDYDSKKRELEEIDNRVKVVVNK
ncbi:hypothetical protein KKH43_01640 [Patescibacteria group bacterium]|nr:hypothetical protein [Patescibacteria group bacterium]